MPPAERLSKLSKVTARLTLMSDHHLSELLSAIRSTLVSIGGTSGTIEICNTSVFVKRIPLTELELQPANRFSTGNLFHLPCYCQYGIGLLHGSPGFGAWRELASHIMTSNWVIAGDCAHFPLLYHWRILPKTKANLPDPDLSHSVRYWENSPAVRSRLESKLGASSEIVLFLEYIPHTLQPWAEKQFQKGKKPATAAFNFIKKDLIRITDFLSQHEFTHFDAHFRNILTDGERLYLSDFGLAIFAQFDLSKEEASFLKIHRHYDRYLSITNLMNQWISTQFGAAERDAILTEYADDKNRKRRVSAIFRKYAAIALAMNAFYLDFQTKTRNAKFPSKDLDKIWKS